MIAQADPNAGRARLEGIRKLAAPRRPAVWGVQTLVPPTMIGRVSSLDWFVSIGLVPISFALTGPIAELIGARVTLGVAGVLGVATCALLFVPGVRDPERRPLESLEAGPELASPL
jgi:hypothetical protein